MAPFTLMLRRILLGFRSILRLRSRAVAIFQSTRFWNNKWPPMVSTGIKSGLSGESILRWMRSTLLTQTMIVFSWSSLTSSRRTLIIRSLSKSFWSLLIKHFGMVLVKFRSILPQRMEEFQYLLFRDKHLKPNFFWQLVTGLSEMTQQSISSCMRMQTVNLVLWPHISRNHSSKRICHLVPEYLWNWRIAKT